MKHRKWLRIALGVGIVALLGGLVIHASTRNDVEVENRSGQVISTLLIRMGGQTLRFDNLADGSTQSATRGGVRGDDHFTLEGQLADGTRIRWSGGYVTGGMYGSKDRFRVEPGGNVVHASGDLPFAEPIAAPAQ
jgi:hypothetical protein